MSEGRHYGGRGQGPGRAPSSPPPRGGSSGWNRPPSPRGSGWHEPPRGRDSWHEPPPPRHGGWHEPPPPRGGRGGPPPPPPGRRGGCGSMIATIILLAIIFAVVYYVNHGGFRG